MEFSYGRGSPPDLTPPSEEDMDVRKGPWTAQEDSLLLDYVSVHGEGRWNAVARCSGLKRTGKSCRLRWLNYLRPDVRRGNITLQEQLMILELHSRWGNRWSKIAQHLPGRTDNEIKNYWRTRVQKQAKQLKCDVNSKQFRDALRYVWIPRLMERIRAASISHSAQGQQGFGFDSVPAAARATTTAPVSESGQSQSCVAESSDFSDIRVDYNASQSQSQSQSGSGSGSGVGDMDGYDLGREELESNVWLEEESVWSEENIWLLQQQLFDL